MKIKVALLTLVLLPTSAYSLSCDNFHSKLKERAEENNNLLYDKFLNSKLSSERLLVKLKMNEKRVSQAFELCRKTNTSELRHKSIPR